MKTARVEIYSKQTNVAVVRVPGRHFPGSVVQGDSLSVLFWWASKAAERARELELEDEELLWSLEELQELLLGRLLHYQEVLDEHGIRLPYSQRRSASDFRQLLPDDEED